MLVMNTASVYAQEPQAGGTGGGAEPPAGTTAREPQAGRIGTESSAGSADRRRSVELSTPIPVAPGPDGKCVVGELEGGYCIVRNIEYSGAGSYVMNYIAVVYRWVAGIIAAVAILMIIVAGIMMIFASGNQSVIDEAKTRILGAAYGLVFLIVSALLLWTVNPGFFGNIGITQPGETIAGTPSIITPPSAGGAAVLPVESVRWYKAKDETDVVGFDPSFPSGLTLVTYTAKLSSAFGATTTSYAEIMYNAAKAENVNPYLVAAIANQENAGNWRNNLISPKGAVGLMQVVPASHTECDGSKLKENQENISCATRFIKSLASTTRSRGVMTVENIAAGYNGGDGTGGAIGLSGSCKDPQLMRWMCAWDNSEHTVLNYTGPGDDRSFHETRLYAPNVAKYYLQLDPN